MPRTDSECRPGWDDSSATEPPRHAHGWEFLRLQTSGAQTTTNALPTAVYWDWTALPAGL